MPKLLVVDDNPHYCRRLKELFELDAHQVATASSADQAIEMGRHEAFDVLVVDRMLHSTLDGFEVATYLQRTHPELKTIVITGYPSPSIEAELDRSNVFAYFEKPFDPEELREAVLRAAGRN